MSAEITILSIWEDLKERLEQKLLDLDEIEKEVPVRVAKARDYCSELLFELQSYILNYVFNGDEEILYYKELEPYFIGQHFFYNQLSRIESDKPQATAEHLHGYYDVELERVGLIFGQHEFIDRYMKNRLTYMDAQLFFRPGPQTAIALYGMHPPADGTTQTCYNHAVGRLIGAGLLREYLLKAKADLSHIKNIPTVVWTGKTVGLIEVGYMMYASKVLNDGKLTLKETFEFLEIVLNHKTGHHSRIAQEIACRKDGYTRNIDKYRDNVITYWQSIEARHIK